MGKQCAGFVLLMLCSSQLSQSNHEQMSRYQCQRGLALISGRFECAQTDSQVVTDDDSMQDDSLIESTAEGAGDGAEYLMNQKGVAWLDMFLGLIGRRQAKLSEPSDEAIKRTQEYLREKAKGATFFESVEVDTVRPMLEVAWAPMLGAFSVLYEQNEDEYIISLCLQGELGAMLGILVHAHVLVVHQRLGLGSGAEYWPMKMSALEH